MNSYRSLESSRNKFQKDFLSNQLEKTFVTTFRFNDIGSNTCETKEFPIRIKKCIYSLAFKKKAPISGFEWPEQVNSELYISDDGSLLQDGDKRILGNGIDSSFIRNSNYDKKRIQSNKLIQSSRSRESSKIESNLSQDENNDSKNVIYGDNNGGILIWLSKNGYLYICFDEDEITNNMDLSLWTQLKSEEINNSPICVRVIRSKSQIGKKLDSFDSNHDLKKIQKIGVGKNHILFETTKKQLYALGKGRFGACGTGIESEWIGRPVEVAFHVPNYTEIKKICCGENHTLILLTNGQVFGCGSNHFGELGKGKLIKRVPIPQQIILSNNKILQIKEIACGLRFSVFLTTEGEIYCTGFGTSFGYSSEIFNPIKINQNNFRFLSNYTPFTPRIKTRKRISISNNDLNVSLNNKISESIDIDSTLNIESKNNSSLNRSLSPNKNLKKNLGIKNKSPRKLSNNISSRQSPFNKVDINTSTSSFSWEDLLEKNSIKDHLGHRLVSKPIDDIFDEFKLPKVVGIFCGDECLFIVTKKQKLFFIGKNDGIIPSGTPFITQPTEIFLETIEDLSNSPSSINLLPNKSKDKSLEQYENILDKSNKLLERTKRNLPLKNGFNLGETPNKNVWNQISSPISDNKINPSPSSTGSGSTKREIIISDIYQSEKAIIILRRIEVIQKIKKAPILLKEHREYGL